VRELPSDPLFLEPGLDWRAVSPRLITERRVPIAILGAVALGVLVLGVVLDSGGAAPWWPFGIVAAVMAAICSFLWFVLVPRVVMSWRYAEREQDLLVRHGRLVRRLTVVPYGRMQVIQVRSNPVANRLGIATVTDATIPGLPSEVAQALRDRLAAKGEALTAGL
jgi:membrane protein YdbS with pleckstrin-like domain